MISTVVPAPGTEVTLASPELQAVHDKIMNMSAELQELSKQKSADKAEIIELERKRISRELHDSVSQELFAATMILSSVAGSTQNSTKEQIETQAQLVLMLELLEQHRKDFFPLQFLS